MTKGEIVAAIVDFDGDVAALRDILNVVTNRIKNMGRNLVEDEIRPRLNSGEDVRVEISWKGNTTRKATVQKINRTTVVCIVDGEPTFRNLWRIRHASIRKMLP